MDEIELQFGDGIRITVPRSLKAITTYVLLEQEAWFEKEARFVSKLLSPGQTVLDIGANLGVYSLAMAKRVGPTGRVIAYEPASETRAALEKSARRNGFGNLEIVAAALSNKAGEARLSFGWSSELNSLSSAPGAKEGEGETVRLVTLDEEDRVRQWPSVDFIKMDAEGEEFRILEGGSEVFARHSPIVMFEVRSALAADDSIPDALKAMGFGIYRLICGAPLLVPVGADDVIDRNELNLFALKPDRVCELAGKGLLVAAAPPAWTPDEAARGAAIDLIQAQVFAQGFAQFFRGETIDPAYRSALAGYAAWRSAERSLAERYAALLFAYRKLLDLCQMGATPARLSTLARVAWELGRTAACEDAINALIKRGEGTVSEPFWPVNARFDAIDPGGRPGVWFLTAAIEQLERYMFYSSLFNPTARNVEWLVTQPFVSAEIERRCLLKRLKAGERLAVPERLLRQSADHINAEVWRAGLVPNTLV